MLKIMLTALSGMLLCGCFATHPLVRQAASADELNRLLAKIDHAANPAKCAPHTVRMRWTGKMSAMNVNVIMENAARFRSKQFVSRAAVSGMPVVVELYDGKNAYNIVRGVQSKKLSGKQLAQQRAAAAGADPAIGFADRYENIRLDSRKVLLDKQECFRIVASPKGEPELPPQELFFDCKTFLLRQERSVIATDMGEIPCVTDFLRYRTVKGLPLPEKLRVRQLAMSIEVELTSVELDQELPDRMFDCEAIENEAD